MNLLVHFTKLLQHSIAHRVYGLAAFLGLWSLLAFSPGSEEELVVTDCGTNAVTSTLINSSFSAGSSGLSYQDDAFLNTNEPGYASGSWGNGYGRTGGGLRVVLGGLDNSIINNMSGGWEYTFTLTEAAEVNLNFWYNLFLASNYESDEYADAYLSIDGSETFLSRLVGDGNGGNTQSTGWQEANVNLGFLPAGSHTVRLGAFNNKKTWSDESTEMYLDDLTVTSTTGITLIDSENFETGSGDWISQGSDAFRYFDSFYANSGSYSFQLRDNSGTNSSMRIDLDLSTFSEITVDFSYITNSFDNSSEDFFLQISTNNGSSYTTVEEWNLGDEFQNLERKNESVTIQGPFSSNSRLRFLCDASANGDQVYIDDIVIRGCEIQVNQAPIASFTASPTSGDAPLQVNFDASASSDPESDPLTYAWNFGDGNSGSGILPSHIYQVPGTFTATLTVNDGEFTSTATETIIVSEAPDTEAPSIPQNITASNTTQTSTDLSWDASTDNVGVIGYYIFQDGGSTPIDTVIGTSATLEGLNESSTYQFAIAAFDAEGNVSAQSSALQVTTAAFNQGPIASFIATPTSGEAPLSVAFDASASSDSDGTLVSYAWDFGDGNVGTGITTSNTYDTEGVYSAQLIVTDDSAAVDTFTVVINATRFNVGPIATFTATPTSGEAPLSVTFDASGSSDPDGFLVNYAWDFGDGNTATGSNPSNTYTGVGSYTAVLVVTDDSAATDTFAITITVNETADTEAPSIPQNLLASNPTQTTIDLSWDAATDNVGVVGYLIYQDGSATPIDTVIGTSYTATGLTEATNYQFAVAAFDAAGNVSAQSQAVQASTSSPITCETPSNIALGRDARQSSTYGNGVAGLAVDGNTTGTSPWSADLQHTTNEFQPWWEVDLGANSQIDSVILYNRTDGFQFRLSDFYVLTSMEPMEGTAAELLADPAVSQTFFLGGAGQGASIPINVEGRYVRIQLMNTTLLHMAEVAVIGCNLEQVCELPTVAITPLNPIAEDGGIQQLEASPAGGTWGGTATAEGSFDPSVGVGLYPVYYTYTEFPGCEATDTLVIEVLAAGSTCDTMANLALNKAANQSSTYGNGVAALAVDGNTTGTSPWSADLQHTTNENQPWWEVDLGQISDIEGINIFNRSDKNQDRLNNFYILVSNDPFAPGASLAALLGNNNIEQTFFSGPAGLTEAISFFATGRYVRIQLSGAGLIHVAEIEVMGCASASDPCSGVGPIAITPLNSIPEDAEIQQLTATPVGGVWGGAASVTGLFDPGQGAGSYTAIYTYDSGTGCTLSDSILIEVTPVSACESTLNLALGSAARQSSTYGNGIADLAIDGDTTGNSPWSADLQHTTNESQPWWEIDLGQISEIETIKIFNRDEKPERLIDFYVFISDTPFDTTATLADILASAGVTQVFFPGQAGDIAELNVFSQGRYVRIQLSGSGILHMAEVEIYGCGETTDPCADAAPVVITPVGPFVEDAGIQQLVASPAGGDWGGAAAQDGSFDPSVGAGIYSISYTYFDSLGCGGSDTIQIEVLPVVDPCADAVPVVITPAGPFIEDAGIQQLVASPAGGDWGGAAAQNGSFDPSVGAGIYSISYTYFDSLGCGGSDTIQIEVLPVVDPCADAAPVVITPAGPFIEDAGIQQLVASPAGGDWGGAAAQNGSFDPSVGAGIYSVSYTYFDSLGCGGSDTIQIEVLPVVDPCADAAPVVITPAGPFIEDAGVQQLVASPAGGDWGGAAAQDGSFDPSVGAGIYSISYTYFDSLGCGGSDTISIVVLPVEDDSCATPSNLALNQAAMQSSTYFGGVAGLAVDGNRIGTSATDSPPNLQHTLNESQPWWQVNLGQISRLDTLRIFNRTDVLPERLNNFYVLTSTDPIDTTATLTDLLQDNSITQQFFSGAADSIETLILGGTLGQYVRVQLNGSGFLHVAEIEVIGCPFTGCIDPVVSIENAGPFAEDAGPQQLVGTPAGGIWAGNVSADGTFDPSIGVGMYAVSYTYTDSLGCSAVATDSIEVVPGGGVCTVLTNLALNKDASQSSTYFGGIASIAVDGNQTGSTATSNPPDLQHTLNEAQPWWQVDLGQKSNLSRIDIYNRSDVLPERLNNFYVLVSNVPFSSTATLDELLQDGSITQFFFSGPASIFETIELNDTEGRYLRVQLSGSGFLHVAEIEVWGCDLGDECIDPVVSIDPAGPFVEDEGPQQLVGNPVGGIWSGSVSATGIFDPSQGEGTYEVIYTYVDTAGCSASAVASIDVLRAGSSCTSISNLALNRSAQQSSTYFGGIAGLAVDGNQTGTSATSNPPDLQHTLNESQPWWQVDLGQISVLDQVTIYNRSDVLPERLNNFYLLISNAPFSDTASLAGLLQDTSVNQIFFSGPAGFQESFVMNDLEGRYVRIQLSGSGFLHMAEVEVMGCPSPNDPCFNAELAEIDPVPSLSIGSGVYQLTASPAGGIWTGDVAPDGTFDAGNCPGVFEVIYTYLNGGTCESADTVNIVVQPDTMDVFIYAGQSNATGAQGASQNLAIGASPYDGNISYAWNIPTLQNSNGWDVLQAIQVDPIREGHGAEISFGRTLYENGYTNLGIIKVAEGGTSLDGSWDPTSPLSGYDSGNNRGMYPEMLSYVNARLAELTAQGIPYKLSGFLWHQGEGDMNPTMADRYEANLREFIDSLRSEFGADLQVFAASVYNPNATVEQGETVRAAQVSVASSTAGVYVVDLDEVYYDNNLQPNSENLVSDNLHYNSLGQVRVGAEFASTYQNFNAIEGCETGSLCSVSENIALNKVATQSSTYFGGAASLAVDGNRSGSSATTTPPDLQHTLSEVQPWWQVDLGAVSIIEQVKVYNRTDCCQGRLNNFYVLWSDQPFDTSKTLDSLLTDPTVSSFRFNGAAGLVATAQIDSMGRYVRIHHTREAILHMAEVEVIGCSEISQAARFDNVQNASRTEPLLPVVNIFPNPADRFTTLEIENVPFNEQIEYSLYNLTGQRVWFRTGTISEKIDVQGLSQGMYMLMIQGEGWSETKQLLVN